jgi:phytoene dehydrogenase-like protein
LAPQNRYKSRALLARLPALLAATEAPDALAREVASLAPLDEAALAAAARDPRALHALLRDLAVLVSALVVEPKAKAAAKPGGGAAPPRDRVPAVIARPFARLCGIAHMQTDEGVWYPMGGTRAVPLALEKLAREQLQMRTVTPAITQYARMGDTSASANAPASDKQVTPP